MRRECFISGLHLVTHWAKVPVRVVWCLVPRGYWHVSGKLGKHLIAHKWTWWADVFVCSVTQSCPALCDSMKSNQAPLFIRLPSQEYQSGLPFPPPVDLPYPEKLKSHVSCASCISRQILYHCATWKALGR